MAVAPPILGTIATGFHASAVGPLAPTYPGGLSAGDPLLCRVTLKPTTANDGTPPTITGWSLVESLTGANDGDTGGYGSTAPTTADQGNVNIWLFLKDALSDGTESGTISVAFPAGGVASAQIFALHADAGVGSILYGASKDVAGASSGSIILGTTIAIGFDSGDVDAGDLVLGFFTAPSDAPAYGTPSIAHTGATFGAVTLAAWSTNLGADSGGFSAYAIASAGPSSADDLTLTVTATSAGNARGPAIFLRVREASGGGSVDADVAEDAPAAEDAAAGDTRISVTAGEGSPAALDAAAGDARVSVTAAEGAPAAVDAAAGALALGAAVAESAAGALDSATGATLVGLVAADVGALAADAAAVASAVNAAASEGSPAAVDSADLAVGDGTINEGAPAAVDSAHAALSIVAQAAESSAAALDSATASEQTGRAPAERTFRVAPDVRAFRIAFDSRIFQIEPEVRSFRV